MAYQAIVNGARGLNFFGGHLTQVATPADAEAGWNWTFWERVLRPVVARARLAARSQPALVAPDAKRRREGGDAHGHRARHAARRRATST